MRVLVSSTAGSGHFGPLVPVLEALARRGDEALVVVPPNLEAAARATGHAVLLGRAPDDAALAPMWATMPTLARAERSLLVEREIFGRLCTAAMLPALERACGAFRPDLLVHETCEYAAAVVADRHDLAQAQVAISAAVAEAGAQQLAAPALEGYGKDVAPRLSAAPYLDATPGIDGPGGLRARFAAGNPSIRPSRRSPPPSAGATAPSST